MFSLNRREYFVQRALTIAFEIERHIAETESSEDVVEAQCHVRIKCSGKLILTHFDADQLAVIANAIHPEAELP